MPRKTLILFVGLVLWGCAARQPQIITPSITPVLPTENILFLDFDHPRLHEIADDKPLVIVELARKNDQDSSYVAVVVETGDPMERREMLLFRVTNGVSTLIYDLEPDYYVSLNIQNENHPEWLMKNTSVIQSGLQFPVMVSNGGNCYVCSQMIVIGVTEDGNAKDITPVTDFFPKGFVYTTKTGRTGRIDLVAVQYYEFDYGAKCHICSPYAFRLYAWDGDNYVDVSEEEVEFYDEKIKELKAAIQNSYGEPFDSLVMPLLSEMFFHYESSGRVAYGWEQIQKTGDLNHWDIQNTMADEIQTYHEVFDQLKQRRDADLSIATQPSP